ncbi:MAG: aromatic-ring-hydroxylating dioxygenase subunit beta [Burkholderiaceae bacterium]
MRHDDIAALTQQARSFIEQESYHLDSRDWDAWLAMYHPDCEFWVPTWIDGETLGQSPQTALSHMYYASRGGLEDRVARLRTKQSPASNPMPRTAHLLSHFALHRPPEPDELELRYSWCCHVFFPRDNSQTTFFGRAHALLCRSGDGGQPWLIRRKRVELLNDYVPTMLDFYCL